MKKQLKEATEKFWKSISALHDDDDDDDDDGLFLRNVWQTKGVEPYF